MSETEEQLETRIRARDSQALVVYLEMKKLPLLSIIERRLGADLRKRIEPEDVLQEVGMSAISNLANSEDPPNDIFPWLCRTIELRIIDLARHHKAEKRDLRREVSGNQQAAGMENTSGDLIALLSASLTSASMRAVRCERQSKLDECLSELPESTRNVLRMRYGDGLATKEIAKRMGKSDVAIRVLISRTVQDLQKRLVND